MESNRISGLVAKVNNFVFKQAGLKGQVIRFGKIALVAAFVIILMSAQEPAIAGWCPPC